MFQAHQKAVVEVQYLHTTMIVKRLLFMDYL